MWKILIVAVAALLAAPPAPAVAAGDKPNLVIIFADDMGYADMACNGGKDVVTPNLDKLATEGMRLTSFYVTQGQCSPSRASILTGCYANRVGINVVLSPA